MTRGCFYTQALLNRSFDTQALSCANNVCFCAYLHVRASIFQTLAPRHKKRFHADAVTHRNIYTQQAVTRRFFTHRCSHARKFTGAHASTRWILYAWMPSTFDPQVPLHTVCSDAQPALTSRSLYTQMVLDPDAFPRAHFYTQAARHTDAAQPHKLPRG